MKRKHGWVVAWLLSLTAAFGLYAHTALSEAARPPSEGWSRPIAVARLEGLSAYELRNCEDIAVMKEENGIGVLYRDPSRGLVRVSLGPEGERIASEVLSAEFPPTDRLLAFRNGQAWHLAALQEGRVALYAVAGETVTPEGTLPAEGIRRFDRYLDRYALIASRELLVGNREGLVGLPGSFQAAKWVPTEAPILCTVMEQEGKRLLQFLRVAEETELLVQWPLPSDAQTAVETLAPYRSGDAYGALVELKDVRTGKVRLMDYRAGAAMTETEVLSSGGDISPVVAGTDSGTLALLLIREQRMGDDEVLWNVQWAGWDGRALSSEAFVTQSPLFSVPVDGWSTGTERYVLSADLAGDAKTLMLSGTSSLLREQTQSLNRQEILLLLPGILMTLLPSLMVGLFPCIYILVPVLLGLFAVSVLRFSWAEARAGLMVKLSMGAHVVLKGLFAFQWILYNGNIPDMAYQLPGYLNTPGALLGALLLSTVAAWGVARLKGSDGHPGDYWGPYARFALIDISIFILLVMPYYYAYAGLPVFIR